MVELPPVMGFDICIWIKAISAAALCIFGYVEGRAKDNFDEWGYLASNTDLMKVFGSNTTQAIKHYISFGKSEDRKTNLFDAEAYLNNYADLKSAFGNNHELARKHYVENGFKEGRIFS